MDSGLFSSMSNFARRIAAPFRSTTHFPDMEPEFLALAKRIKPYTMTSIERMYALFKAVEHIETHKIPGDIVECGVWKGGSAMLAALTLLQLKSTLNRRLFLFDTFSGMAQPGDNDISASGEDAREIWSKTNVGKQTNWCLAGLDEVRRNMDSTGYPPDRITYVEGRVEDTLPRVEPQQISILRLDTDWYASTYHELTHLYPRLPSGGVLLIDDYGYWKGAREATDRYLKESRTAIFLSRVDDTGRIGIKP